MSDTEAIENVAVTDEVKLKEEPKEEVSCSLSISCS